MKWDGRNEHVLKSRHVVALKKQQVFQKHFLKYLRIYEVIPSFSYIDESSVSVGCDVNAHRMQS